MIGAAVRMLSAMDLPIDLDRVRATLRAHGVTFALVFGSHATGRARGEQSAVRSSPHR